MVDAMIDSLKQHNDDRSIIRSPVQMQDLAQVCPLRDCNQFLSRSLCASSQFVDARKSAELLQWRGGGRSGEIEMSRITFFGTEQVYEDFAHTAKHPLCRSV